MVVSKSLRSNKIKCQKIVYVSCNPSTQARDLETLNSMGYSLTKTSLVDQFPHTAHVKASCYLAKIKSETIHNSSKQIITF